MRTFQINNINRTVQEFGTVFGADNDAYDAVEFPTLCALVQSKVRTRQKGNTESSKKHTSASLIAPIILRSQCTFPNFGFSATCAWRGTTTSSSIVSAFTPLNSATKANAKRSAAS